MKIKFLTIFSLFCVSCVALGALLFNLKIFDDKEKIYPEGIKITEFSRDITLYLNNSLYFLKDPYKITPSDAECNVETEITDYRNNIVETASFENNCFSASKKGSYYIHFKTKNKYGKILKDCLKITVVDRLEDASDYIEVNNSLRYVYKGDEIDLKSFGDVKLDGSRKFEIRDSEWNITADRFVADSEGVNNINLCINCDNILIFSTICVVEKIDRPVGIILQDKHNQNIDEFEVLTYSLNENSIVLYYELENADKQEIKVGNYDASIIDVEVFSPLIIINFKKSGLTTFEIASLDDSVKFEITLNIVE